MRGGRRAIGVLAAAVLIAGCGAVNAPSAAPALRYAVFLAEMLETREGIEGSVTSLIEAGSGAGVGMTAEEVRTAAESLSARITDQRAWLADNPPAECYADVHGAAATFLDSLKDVTTAAIGWADAMGSPELLDPADAFATFRTEGIAAQEDALALSGQLDANACLD